MLYRIELNKKYQRLWLVIMVNVSLGWKMPKMPFILIAFLITLKMSDTLGEFLKDKGLKQYMVFCFSKEKHVVSWNKWDLIPCLQDSLSFRKTLHSDNKSMPRPLYSY